MKIKKNKYSKKIIELFISWQEAEKESLKTYLREATLKSKRTNRFNKFLKILDIEQSYKLKFYQASYELSLILDFELSQGVTDLIIALKKMNRIEEFEII